MWFTTREENPIFLFLPLLLTRCMMYIFILTETAQVRKNSKCCHSFLLGVNWIFSFSSQPTEESGKNHVSSTILHNYLPCHHQFLYVIFNASQLLVISSPIPVRHIQCSTITCHAITNSCTSYSMLHNYLSCHHQLIYVIFNASQLLV